MIAKALSNQSDDNQSPAEEDFSLYLHIPFCVRKCQYCTFFSISGGDELFERYVRSVGEQLNVFSSLDWVRGRRLKTIFFGGGTPTVLPSELLVELLEKCLNNFKSDCYPEISLEVNPATINSEGLQQLFLAGFNRLSIGVQSFSDTDLAMLGRPHSAGDVEEVYSQARKAGFDNISLDLMYGLPGQSVSCWRKTLSKALQLEPDHLSIYELTIEDGSPFGKLEKQGKLSLPNENHVLDMMAVTFGDTSNKGFHRYEISNYAKPGKTCRHNINYWNNGPYLGAGAGAVSYFSGCRSRAVENVEEYCRKIESEKEPWIERENLDKEAQFRETVVMGLRMTEGVSISDLLRRFNISLPEYYGAELTELEDQKLVVLGNDRLQLTERGLFLANSVMAELV